jgi:anti-sigma regulatory factor (Ser/Thr protein kinase)
MPPDHRPNSSAHRFACDLPATPRSLAALRDRFGQWLYELDVADLHRLDLVLTISELASAILEDRPTGGNRLLARAWTVDDGVVIEMIDTDRTLDARRARGLDPVDAGRSLAVVATLADFLSVRESGGERTIRAHVGWDHLVPHPVSQ